MNKHVSTLNLSDLMDPVLLRPLTDAVRGLNAVGNDSCSHILSSLALKTTIQATGKSQCPLCRAPIVTTRPDTPTQKLAEQALPRLLKLGRATLVHRIPETSRADDETIELHRSSMALLIDKNYDEALLQLNELISYYPLVLSLRPERIDCLLTLYRDTPFKDLHNICGEKQFKHFINDLTLLSLDETYGNRTNILALQHLFL